MPTKPRRTTGLGRYHEAMELAITAAGKGIRGVNPLVGAVLLDPDGTLLATGSHHGPGSPHAEVAALEDLHRRGGDSRGTTLVVTLEPCRHSCAPTVVEAGVGTVVYAVTDPHPKAAGGAALLRQAGLEVVAGVAAEHARELNRRWFRAHHEGRPYTSLRIAQTLDGRIAAADGTSHWISGAESLAAKQELRARVDAVLVGSGTALADNPRLTARDPDGQLYPRQPLRVVLGRRSLPDRAVLSARAQADPVQGWVQLEGRDPLAAGRQLYRDGVRHLMLEGGARVSAAFVRGDLVDELILSLAPALLGAGLSSIGDLGIGTLAEARHFDWDPVAPPRRLGEDLLLTLIPREEN